MAIEKADGTLQTRRTLFAPVGPKRATFELHIEFLGEVPEGRNQTEVITLPSHADGVAAMNQSINVLKPFPEPEPKKRKARKRKE